MTDVQAKLTLSKRGNCVRDCATKALASARALLGTALKVAPPRVAYACAAKRSRNSIR